MTNELLQIQEIKGIQIVETATREANNIYVNYINESKYEFSINNEIRLIQNQNRDLISLSDFKFC